MTRKYSVNKVYLAYLRRLIDGLNKCLPQNSKINPKI